MKNIKERYNQPVFGDVFEDIDTSLQIEDFENGLSAIQEEFNKQYLNFYISRKTNMHYYSNEDNDLIFTIHKDD